MRKERVSCWECSYNVLKLEIMVPHDGTIKEYVRSTGNLFVDLVAVVKDKHGRYVVWTRHGEELKRVTVRMVHACKLGLENKKDRGCPEFRINPGQNQISNIVYSKAPSTDISIQIPKLNPVCLSQRYGKTLVPIKNATCSPL